MFPIKLKHETVAIIGGGPSLKSFDLSSIPEDWSVIVVNNAYRLRPDAEILFFADARWYNEHEDDLWPEFKGRMVTACSQFQMVPEHCAYRLGREYSEPMGDKLKPVWSAADPKAWKLAGRDFGTMAVNLAWHLGARNIVLFGFDMTYQGDECHWHEPHKWPTTAVRYEETFAPRLAKLSKALMSRSVRIWRATEPGIPELPYREIPDIVRDIRGEQ